MKFRSLLILLCAALDASAPGQSEWKTAEPGWQYEFPRDHGAHRDFKTEWWYFTGNLSDAAGRHYGYEITFFREGVSPPQQGGEQRSRFIIDDIKFAHFALTDASGKRFVFDQKTSRGSFGEAGFDDGERLAWIDGWQLARDERGEFELSADREDVRLRLKLRPVKSPVVHGENGVSAKAATAGHASHYYSITRLDTYGELTLNGETRGVRGESWFDHEWATNQLAPDQVGWNWMGLQFSDGTELMLYQMSLASGGTDPGSSGTFAERDGSAVHVRADDFRMKQTRQWRSGVSGAAYPVEWKVEIPGKDFAVRVKPLLDNQELSLGPLTYWEGAVEIVGERAGRPITGRGYLELTGYAGPLTALHR